MGNGGDPRAGSDIGQRYGGRHGSLVGEKADAGHHPRHGAPQTDQYESGGYGRERDQQPERTDDAQRHQRDGQAEDPGADGHVPFRVGVRVGHLCEDAKTKPKNKYCVFFLILYWCKHRSLRVNRVYRTERVTQANA